jgi:Conserved TM helix/Mechanosensitive ion channel
MPDVSTPPPQEFGLLKTLLESFISGVPRFFIAIAVFFIGWLIAKAILKLVSTLLKKSGIDKFGETLNEIEVVHKAGIKILPSNLIANMVYYVLMLLFAVAATDILNMPAISKLISDIIQYVPSLISAIGFLIIGTLLADAIKGGVKTIATSLNVPSANMIANFVFYFLFITVVVSALNQAKINTDFLMNNLTVLLGGGVLAFALGYGFASKEMLASFLASFYVKDKFQIGDVISINGVTGEIIDMDNTSLILQAKDKKIVIPLSKLTTENVALLEDHAPDNNVG